MTRGSKEAVENKSKIQEARPDIAQAVLSNGAGWSLKAFLWPADQFYFHPCLLLHALDTDQMNEITDTSCRDEILTRGNALIEWQGEEWRPKDLTIRGMDWTPGKTASL